MDSIDSSLSPGLLRPVNQSRDKGASSWLNAMPQQARIQRLATLAL